MRSFLPVLALAATIAACSESPVAPTDPPVALDDAPGGWKMIAAGDGQTCGIAKTGLLYCWGKNDRGQLGDGTQLPHSVPTRILSDSAFAMVTAGPLSSCGITISGVAYCWGWVIDAARPAPVLMDAQRRFTTLAAGRWMVCGLVTDGTIQCWSDTVMDSTESSPLPGGRHFRILVSSANSYCGTTTDAAVYCWTATDWGKATSPELRADSPATMMAAVGDPQFYIPGETHLCAIGAGGATYCWGSNSQGQLGLGDRDDREAPTLVASHKFAAIAASGGRTCGVAVNDVAYCWGLLDELGTTHSTSSTAVSLLPGMRTAATSTGPDHYCFLTTGGAAFCAGNNAAGQLGTGTTDGPHQVLRRVLDPQ